MLSDEERKHVEQWHEDMKQIGIALEEARPYNLEAEVIYQAMEYRHAHPNLTIAEAMYYGMCEWLK